LSETPFVTFEIYGMEGKATIALIQGPPNLTDAAQPVPLPKPIQPLSSWPGPNPVQCYGEALLQCLNGVNDINVKEAIKYAVNSDGTIYFKLKSADWEAQAWEALWDDSDFFLLKPRRGIARVVDVARYRGAVTFGLDLPARIMAVLSAAGLSNAPQWDALYRAATQNAAFANGLPVSLHLLTGEEELADRVRHEARKDDRLSVTVANIDRGRVRTVSEQIKLFRPHILHFFCHGQVVQNVGVLRLSDTDQHLESMSGARPADGAPTSFKMDYSAFREIIDLARAQGWLWLTVLNACKLGAAAANVSALTQKFALAGVPAAVGMTEEIEENDASEFCNAFYSSLYLELTNTSAVLQKDDECAIDWAKLLHGPRMGISDRRAPASCYPQWTFPVMYVGGSDFKLKRDRKTTDLAHTMRDGAIQQLRNAPPDLLATIAKVEVK
jgi:hypothetical protein